MLLGLSSHTKQSHMIGVPLNFPLRKEHLARSFVFATRPARKCQADSPKQRALLAYGKIAQKKGIEKTIN